jgi:uncharacterized membrane protein YuzA (DUF378 family)
MHSSYHTKLNMVVVALVLIGALNWGLTAFDYNLVAILDTYVKQVSNMNIPLAKTVYILVALSGLYLAVQRDTWLPFLGYSVLPAQLLANKSPSKPTRKVAVTVEPNQSVLYWASKAKGEDALVEQAYDDYSNSGLVKANDQGIAELLIEEGNGYVLPSGRHLEKHIHYRVVGLQYGMAGPVQTVYY